MCTPCHSRSGQRSAPVSNGGAVTGTQGNAKGRPNGRPCHYLRVNDAGFLPVAAPVRRGRVQDRGRPLLKGAAERVPGLAQQASGQLGLQRLSDARHASEAPIRLTDCSPLVDAEGDAVFEFVSVTRQWRDRVKVVDCRPRENVYRHDERGLRQCLEFRLRKEPAVGGCTWRSQGQEKGVEQAPGLAFGVPPLFPAHSDRRNLSGASGRCRHPYGLWGDP